MKNNLVSACLRLLKPAGKPQTPESAEEFLFRNRLRRSVDFGGATRLFAGIAILGLSVSLVLPFGRAFAAAYVTLDSFSGHPATLQVSGGGWIPGETVSIYLNSSNTTAAATAIVDPTSLFGPVAVTVPANAPQGAVSIIAIGSVSHQTETNSYYVVPFGPSLAVSGSPDTPGSAAAVTGQGYAPGEMVDFAINGTIGGHAVADSSGNFTNGTFTVPNLPTGTYQLHGTGQSSGADAIYYLYIGGFYPSASPSAYYVLPGQMLTFSGSGFAPGEIINVTSGTATSTLSTITANSGGSFANAGSLAVPLSLAGGVRAFHLSGNGGHSAPDVMVTVGTLSGLISPSAYFVAPGDTLTFSGSGFAPGEAVSVYIDSSSSPAATFFAAADGSFVSQGGIVIPYSFADSVRTFALKGQSSNTAASVQITVSGFYPSIIPSDYFVVPGQKFTISGSGFAGGETVAVTMNGSVNTATVASAGGNFTSAPFTAPLAGTNLHMVAVGSYSGVSAATDVAVGRLYPTVSPSAWYTVPGNALIFTGSGFAPGEPVVIVSNSASVGSVTADSAGNFTSQGIVVPFGAKGPVTYMFVGSQSGAAANTTVTVAKVSPYADADSYYSAPGSIVHIFGHSFGGNEPVAISIGSQIIHATSSNIGEVSSTPVTLPFGVASPVVVTLTGGLSGGKATVPITLAPFSPEVTPSTWYAAPGTAISFAGSGFAGGEQVAVTLNGNPVATTTADTSGAFKDIRVAIPVSATAAQFTFTGFTSGASAGIAVSLAGFSPQLNPNTWYAAPGSSLVFTGSGFAPGETLNETYNGSLLSVTAADDGTVTTTPVAIPFSANSASVNFTSSVTHFNQTFSIGVAALSPSIWLSSYYEDGGQPLTVFGGGFGGGEKIRVAFGGIALGDATADTGGNFALVTTVPFGAAGVKIVQAFGQASGASASANFTQPQLYANVQLGGYAGAPGSAVTFMGSGFLPNDTIAVTTDRTGTAAIHSFTADATGSFNDSGWQVPANFTGGALTLTITGLHSFISKSIVYYVTGP